jgi:hypothetical protein
VTTRNLVKIICFTSEVTSHIVYGKLRVAFTESRISHQRRNTGSALRTETPNIILTLSHTTSLIDNDKSLIAYETWRAVWYQHSAETRWRKLMQWPIIQHNDFNRKDYTNFPSQLLRIWSSSDMIRKIIMKNGVFWDVTPCGSFNNWNFGEAYRLHHQGEKSVSSAQCWK